MIPKKAYLVLPVLLLAASVLTVYPTMTLEKPLQSSGTITINADGQAFLNNGKTKKTGTGLTATLTLSGSVRAKGNEELKLDQLSGTLVIDTKSYTIVSGEGEVNKKGKVQINARTSDDTRKLQLVLHGKIQGSDVAFNSPESKLSSLYFLSLTGQATFTTGTTTTSTTGTDQEITTITVTQDRTVTETVTQTQQNTATTTETTTQTVTESGTSSTVTVTETITTTVTETTSTAT